LARVFISHSGGSEITKMVLQAAEAAGHEIFLDSAMGAGIQPGEDWERRLHERLHWADSMVCIITTSYVSSIWCTAEIAIARSRGSRIIPVQAEVGVSHPLLSSLHAISIVGNHIEGVERILSVLAGEISRRSSGWPDDRNPYPGLQAFGVADSRIFFGRNDEVEQLGELLRSINAQTTNTIVLVVGPSGCGKSSLVNAGVIPALAGDPDWLVVGPVRASPDPMEQLIRSLAATARSVGTDWETQTVRRRLHSDGLPALMSDLLLMSSPPIPSRVLLAIEQLEELVSHVESGRRARFLTEIADAVEGGTSVVATLKPEYLEKFMAATVDTELTVPRLFTLRPISSLLLRSVIAGPASVAGIQLDEQLISRLLGDARTGEALPLLAFTLSLMAEGLRRGDQMSMQRYRDLGGVAGALRRRADSALAAAAAASGRAERDVVQGLLRLVAVDEVGHPLQSRVSVDELSDVERRAYDIFIDSRLLITDLEYDTVVIGFSHEAILSEWHPLADAIGEAGSALRLRSSLERAARSWAENGRPSSGLLHGPRLAVATSDEFLTPGTEKLTLLASEFIEKSVAREEDLRRRERLRAGSFFVLIVAGTVVALICGYALITARIVLFNILDENLLLRARLAASSELADPSNLAELPPETILAADVRVALLSADGTAINSRGPQEAPSLGADELDVALGRSEYSIRTARMQNSAEYRVVAVEAGKGRALVVAQGLSETESALATLGSVLAVPISTGSAIAILTAAVTFRGRKKRQISEI
jgi:hypothetical protein